MAAGAMDKYNPHAPMILGNEWVPIRTQPIPLDVNTEYGYYFFHTGSSTVPAVARYYVDTPPPSVIQGQVPLVTVYERGEEIATGPTKTLTLYATSTATTGTAVSLLNGASSAADALRNPSDTWGVQFNPGSTSLGIFFASNDNFFADVQNKRIVRLELDYALAGPVAVSGSPYVSRMQASMGTNAYRVTMSEALDADPAVNLITSVKTLNLGEINHWWSNTAQPFQTADRYPWNYDGLLKMSSAFAQPVQVIVSSLLSGTGVQPYVLTYAALRIIYCEENRFYVGGRYLGDLSGVSDTLTRYDVGHNSVNLRNMDLDAPGTGTFPEREYTVTIRLADTGEGTTQRALSGQPHVEATRQLYPMNTLDGVQINMRFPIGFNFTKERSDIMPAITLRTTSFAVVTGTHSYIERYDAPLYYSVPDLTWYIIKQGIVGRSGASIENYSQMRFYAKRLDGDTQAMDIFRLNNSLNDERHNLVMTAAEFDELPEIADGYKEVTLGFASPTPSFSNTGFVHNWAFSSMNNPADAQWQVLGGRAGYITLVSGSAVPTTYGGFAAKEVTDLSGDIFSTNVDDMSLMFSQQPPDIVSFDVVTEQQSLSVVDPECEGVTPECMVTSLDYNQITWQPYGILETFSDSASGSFGTTDTDQTWTNSGGADGQFVESNGEGHHLVATVNTSVFSSLESIDMYNVEARGTIGIDFEVFDDFVAGALFVRKTSATAHYRFELRWGDFSQGSPDYVQMAIVKGGVSTLASSDVFLPYVPGDRFKVVGQAVGCVLRMKAWKVGEDEPQDWALTSWDEDNTHGPVGLHSVADTSYSGDLPQYVNYDDISFSDLNMGGVELQRLDEEDDEWQTIMRTENQTLAVFNDYEARVDTVTQYRMRTVNALDFYGDWTTSPEITITSPGVTGAGDDGNSVLIFTTNSVQDGSSNLAYVMTWDRDPEEGFEFPEAGDVVLQKMYNRDFVTAYRPLERGGERFSRVILVQNAAIATERLRDGFRSLRDLAWSDVPYVCVRNEVGDRWLATVLVPNGVIKRNRRLLLAQINVIETTATPSVVDPDDEE